MQSNKACVEEPESSDSKSDDNKTVEALKRELRAANELIEALGSDGLEGIDGKVSDVTRELIRNGKLTYSSLYSCMKDLELELRVATERNLALSEELSTAHKDQSNEVEDALDAPEPVNVEPLTTDSDASVIENGFEKKQNVAGSSAASSCSVQ